LNPRWPKSARKAATRNAMGDLLPAEDMAERVQVSGVRMGVGEVELEIWLD